MVEVVEVVDVRLGDFLFPVSSMSKPNPGWRVYSPRYWHYWLLMVLLRLCVFLPKRVHITASNGGLCVPELNEMQRRELAQRHFESLGMGLMEFAFAWWGGQF